MNTITPKHESSVGLSLRSLLAPAVCTIALLGCASEAEVKDKTDVVDCVNAKINTSRAEGIGKSQAEIASRLDGQIEACWQALDPEDLTLQETIDYVRVNIGS